MGNWDEWIEKEDLIIVGAGGFGREIKCLLEELNDMVPSWNFLGWVSEDTPGEMIDDLPVLGDTSWLSQYEKEVSVVIAIGNGKTRKRIVEQLKDNPKLSFPNIIAHNVVRSDNLHMGQGNIITYNNVLTTNISMGNFVVCNLSNTIGHDCVIEDYVTLFPKTAISGCCKLKECCSIGTGASIIQGCSIGENSFVGAGAAVINDIPGDCVAVGVPARERRKK